MVFLIQAKPISSKMSSSEENTKSKLDPTGKSSMKEVEMKRKKGELECPRLGKRIERNAIYADVSYNITNYTKKLPNP